MISADGMRSGFDIDISNALAPPLGRPLQFLPFRWPELSAGAKEGAFDLIASGVTIRPDRVLVGRFTRPYAVSEAVVLVRAQDAQRFHGLADLDREGIRVAVNRGGYLEGVARASFVHTRIEPVDNNRKLGEAVTGGAAEALVTDSIEARHLAPPVRAASR
jgi:ABC-type amino acid transport substrate-binding protein